MGSLNPAVLPQHRLPLPLRDENPAGIWRRINGRLTDRPVSEG